MSHNVFINRIKKLISDLYATNDTLVVLKGIPISLVDSSIERIHLEDAVSNKLGYFMSICGKRRILAMRSFFSSLHSLLSSIKRFIFWTIMFIWNSIRSKNASAKLLGRDC